MMTGMVMKSTGSWYEVRTDNGGQYQCRTRGKLRLKGIKTTNPIAVGDIVHFTQDEEGEEQQGIIEQIAPRDNYIIRQSIKNKHHGHIIAANIDQALLVVTLVYPRTSMGFIDRFLVSAEAFRIPQILVFNKTDLLHGELLEIQREIMEQYRDIGAICLEVSAKENTGLEDVKQLLRNKKTLLSGHSGVGKSTMVNQIAPGLELKTSAVSDFAEKGVHTTTFAEMFEISEGTFIIDTPGIKELGLIDIDKDELSDYFPEMRSLQGECKFYNCNHTHEPGCAVKAAVAEGIIADTRYESYLSMLDGDDNRR